jgi:hypothetical protein
MINLVADRKDYYIQINNELDKNISCQCTTMVAGLYTVYKDIRIVSNVHTFLQPEDDLRHYIGTDSAVLEFNKRSHPGSTIHPSEWADTLVYAVNKIYGKRVVYFDGNLTPDKIKTDLYNNKPVMVSLRFPEKGISGHYVLVVGEDNGNFIVNDPYKNFLKNTPDGFNCMYTPDDWNIHSKGYGIRYC